MGMIEEVLRIAGNIGMIEEGLRIVRF